MGWLTGARKEAFLNIAFKSVSGSLIACTVLTGGICFYLANQAVKDRTDHKESFSEGELFTTTINEQSKGSN